MNPTAPMPPLFSTRPDAARRRSPISLTPLIDVVFILLVFFMLASTFLDWRSIEVAAPKQAGGGTTLEGSLLVDLRADGLRLAGQTLSLEEMAEQVNRRLAENPDTPILLRSGEGVAYGRLVEVLDRLNGAGATNLSLIASGVRP